MRYLKRFNESVNKEDINDILLELKDNDFEIKSNEYDESIELTFYKPDPKYHIKRFRWGEVKDCILRLIDYLGDDFIEFTYRKIFSYGTYVHIHNIGDKEKLEGISIYYKKNTKHLEKFNESVNREDIDDILLEIKDLDIKIVFDSVNPRPFASIKSYQITGYCDSPDDKITKFSDIKDCLLRLKDYLGDSFVGFWYSYWYPFKVKDHKSWNNSGFSLTKLSEDLVIDSPIRGFMIRYIMK